MIRRRGIPSIQLYLFGYFAAVMLLGGVALKVLPAWRGDQPITLLDAFFTSVSAVAVTGLITLNTAEFSFLGQLVILLLIQFGGLGIIAFSTLYLSLPRRRISLQRRAIIREYFIGSLEYDPRRIVRNVVLSTLALEGVLAVILVAGFSSAGVDRVWFTAIFHAVSAFCNAGFSTFSDGLESFVSFPAVTVPIMSGLVLGGLGFVVYQDVFWRLRKQRHVLSLHTKLVAVGTLALIVGGFLFFLVVEWDGAFLGLTPGDKVLAALFQSVTPRTAGFNTVSQAELTAPGSTLTMVLMFIGGSPGSIAGGVKVTTVFVILLGAFGMTHEDGNARIFRRKLPARIISRAMLFVTRAVLIVIVSLLLLTVTEDLIGGRNVAFLELLFETLSAFATVGLSKGITPYLTGAGKVVIICTMFAGRVGLISLAIPAKGKQWQQMIDYPSGEVLVG